MGIPVGKLDLLTSCGGIDPRRTIPVIIDVGCAGHSEKVAIRDHELYTGLGQDRLTHKTREGVVLNSVFHGPDNIIEEFMQASAQLFGSGCLLQFEDFNAN